MTLERDSLTLQLGTESALRTETAKSHCVFSFVPSNQAQASHRLCLLWSAVFVVVQLGIYWIAA